MKTNLIGTLVLLAVSFAAIVYTYYSGFQRGKFEAERDRLRELPQPPIRKPK